MPAIKTVSDVSNAFLGRRELVCDFGDSSGRLRRAEAIKAVTAEHGLDAKLVVPVRLQNHVGQTRTTETFFVYDDESAARAHIDPSVMERIEKSRAAGEEAAKAEEASDGTAPGEAKEADGADGGEAAPDAAAEAKGGGQ